MGTTEDELRRRLEEADHLEGQIRQLEAGSAASPEGAFSPEFEARTQDALDRARAKLTSMRGGGDPAAPVVQEEQESPFDRARRTLEQRYGSRGSGVGTPPPGQAGVAHDPFAEARRRLAQRSAELAPGTPDGSPDGSPEISEEESTPGDFFRNLFTEERGRLGLGEEAARAAARTPGQMVEGAGGTAQAGGVGLRRLAALRFPSGAPVFENTGEDIERLGERVEGAGRAVSDVGRTSREFFPASTDVDRLDLTDPNALVAGGVEAIAQVGIQLGLAAATGGGSAVSQFMMFAGPTAAMEGGQTFIDTKAELLERGMSEEEAEQLAAGVAVTTGAGAVALERIPAARFVFRSVPGAERLFGGRFAAALAGKGNLGTQLLTGGVSEAVEESAEEAWSSLIQDIQANNPDAWEKIGPRLAAGAVFGAAGGVGGAAIQAGVEATGQGFPEPPADPDAAPAGPVTPSAGSESIMEKARARIAERSRVIEREAEEAKQQEEAEAARIEEPGAAADPEVVPDQEEDRRGGVLERIGRRVADLSDPDRARRLEELEGVTAEQAEQLRQQEAELKERWTDRLTGLQNQDAWVKARERYDEEAGTSVPGQEILWLDLRGFKAVNDNEGETQGDNELKRIADIVREVPDVELRDKQRAGGDEFALIVPEGLGEDVGGFIQERFGERQVEGTDFTLGVRFGVGAQWQAAARAAQAKKAEEIGPRHRDTKAPAASAPEPTPQERAAEESRLDQEAGRRAQTRATERVQQEEEAAGPLPAAAARGQGKTAELFTMDDGRFSVAVTDEATGKREPGVRRFPDEAAARAYMIERTSAPATAAEEEAAPGPLRPGRRAVVVAVSEDPDFDVLDEGDEVTIDTVDESAGTASILVHTGADQPVRYTDIPLEALAPQLEEEVEPAEPTAAAEPAELPDNDTSNPGAPLDGFGERTRRVEIKKGRIIPGSGRTEPTITYEETYEDGTEVVRDVNGDVIEMWNPNLLEEGETAEGVMNEAIDALDARGRQRQGLATPVVAHAVRRVWPDATDQEVFQVEETMRGIVPGQDITLSGLDPDQFQELMARAIEIVRGPDEGTELEAARDRPRLGGPGAPSSGPDLMAMVLDGDQTASELEFFETVGVVQHGGEDLILIQNIEHDERPDWGRFSLVARNDETGDVRLVAGIDGLTADEIFLYPVGWEQVRLGDVVHSDDPAAIAAVQEFKTILPMLPDRAIRKRIMRAIPADPTDELATEEERARPQAEAEPAPPAQLTDTILRQVVRFMLDTPVGVVRQMNDSELATAVDDLLTIAGGPVRVDEFEDIDGNLPTDLQGLPLDLVMIPEPGEYVHLRGFRNDQSLTIRMPDGQETRVAGEHLRRLVRDAMEPTDPELERAGQLRLDALLTGGSSTRRGQRSADAHRNARATEAAAQREAETEGRVILPRDVIADSDAAAEIEAAEEADARELEGAPQEEPEAGPTQGVSGDGEIGTIEPAPRGGRPGGPRDVSEDDRAPRAESAEVDPRPDREGGDGSRASGDRAGERPGEPGSRSPGRVSGLNLTITDDLDIGGGGPITKTRRNLEAIRILKDVEAQGRQATRDEQKKLALYAGWGGIPQVFNLQHARFGEFATELKELLTPAEYRAAMDSTVNAHFTSREVIRAMHDAMERLGLPSHASVLEPAMGIGHFVGLGPSKHRWFGIELDSLTGRMAQLIYPGHEIHQRGFEETPLPDNHFDAAISNVPFGDFVVDDPAYRDLKFSIHNYFFAKALDKVRPGGVVAFITSSFTMDASSAKVRKYMAERADFIGAVRLPETAFRKSSGTDVVTDIIFLRKRAEGDPPSSLDQPWTGQASVETPQGPTAVNEYYAANPDQIVGTLTLTGSMYGDRKSQMNVEAREGSFPQQLAKALANLPQDVVTERQGPQAAALEIRAVTEVAAQEGSMRVVDGEIMQVQGGRLVEAKVAGTQTANVKALIGLRDQARALLGLQLDDAPDAEITAAREQLNKLYDRYVAKRGPINKEKITKANTVLRPNYTPFRTDPDAPLVSALERYDSENGTAEKAPIFSRRVIEPRRDVTEVDQPTDALPVSLAALGRVDLDHMAQLAGVTRDEMIQELRGRIYQDPETKEWQTEDEYLSGDVRTKLILAKEFAKQDPAFGSNVEALEQVQPEDLPPSKIEVSLGSPWIPPHVYEDFINEILETGDHNRIHLGHSEARASWVIERGYGQGPLSIQKWGTKNVRATRIFELALNQQRPTVRDSEKKVDPKATLDARAKLHDMKEHFREWVWKREDADALAREYNDRFNNTRVRQFDGAHLAPVGMSPGISLRPHQKDAAWRIISSGNTMLAHAVGAGKTFTMQVASMEEKRMGLANKPVHVVPNHMLEQYSREFLQLYPSARLLAAEGKDFTKEKRQALLARIATGDWDAIVMTHSAFGRMDVSRETRRAFAENELAEVEEQLRQAKAESVGETKIVKMLVKARKRAQANLDKLMKAEAKDPGLTFEELGIDRLYLDEAHLFKNLSFTTKMEGISKSTSQRATDMFMKIQYLEGLNPGRSSVFATATPIANSMAEVYRMMRYLQGPLLEQRGIAHFDAWAAQFGETRLSAEIKPDGSGFRMKERFSRFVNIPELSQMFRQVWDVKRMADLDLKVPRIKGGTPRVVTVPASPELTAFVATLAKRAEGLGSVDPSEDNMLKITTEGRKAALDMRLIDSRKRRDPEGKIERAADEIYDIWTETEDVKGTQLVWIDFSAPKPDGFHVYGDLRQVLIERGIPAKDIAFIHDATTDLQKAQLFQKVRDGRVRILFGSTEKMGVGTNVQTRIVAMHHLDAPWRPADIEQRNGRGVRQGNMNDELAISYYVTEGSFDAYMWQGLERKQFSIEQVMTGDPSLREIEDVGAGTLNASETKALASGNPLAIEKASVDSDVARIQRAQRAHMDEQYSLRQAIARLPGQIEAMQDRLNGAQSDAKRRVPTAGDKFGIRIGKAEYADRAKAGELLTEQVANYIATAEEGDVRRVGTFAGFSLELGPPLRSFGPEAKYPSLRLRGDLTYQVALVELTELGLVRRLEALAERVPNTAQGLTGQLKDMEKELEQSRRLEGEPFARADELQRLQARKAEIDKALNITGRQEDEQVEVVEDGVAEETYGEAGLTQEELEERGDAGFLDIRPLFERRRDQLVTSEYEEVEARFQKSKGIPQPGLFEKARNAWEDFKAAMTRAHPEIDPDESTTMALNQDILRQFASARDWSMAMAYSEIRKVTEGLNPAQADLVTRMLVLPDIQKDLEEGLYEGREDDLPFGYSEERLEVDLAKFSAAAAEDLLVQDALKRRGELNRVLTRRLVKNGLLPKGVLDDDRYYHRQVLKYFQARDFIQVNVGGNDIRLRTKGFQKARVGGGDFNTAYQESEIEWVSQAYELLARLETLERLQQLNDIYPELKKQARAHNFRAAMEAWVEQEGIQEGEISDRPDPFQRFKVRIAFSNAALAKMAAAGDLDSEGGRFAALIDDLGAAYDDWKSEMAARDKELREPFRFEHGSWFDFLSHLLEHDLPGSMQAATIFKAIQDREKVTKELAGRNYIDPRNAKELARKLAPEGYRDWQPDPGTQLFLGLTVEQRTVEAVFSGERTLEREDVRQQLMVGGPKETWIIRSNLAQALNNIRPFHDTDAVDNIWTKGQQSWKQWILLNPIRFLRYNVNNMSGDTDIAFAYDPQIVKGAVQAAKDLAKYFRGNASKPLEDEILRLTKLGVIGSTLRVAEIPDINEAGAFRFLTEGKLNPGQKVINRYWTSVRGFTDWRENILRLSAVRYFDKRLAENPGEPVYAASRRSEIDAIQDSRQRSAKLARELIGDYGNISKGGVWMRRHLIPFYSWIEINAPRYYRLLKNAPHEGQAQGRGRRLSAVGAKKTGMFILKANVLFVLANLWNHLFFPDEEEELGRERRQLHLILGRREDGTIRSLRFEGALSDALEWFNLQDYPSDIADLLANRKDILDQGAEFVKAPVERIVNSWEPFSKTIFETFLKRSTYPTVFEEGASFAARTRPVRDRAEHVARTFSLDRLYNRVTGKPRRRTGNMLDDLMGSILLYSTDPGQAAFWQTRDMVSDYLEESGQERADISPTRRSTALYYWKRAIQWGDEAAAERWEAEYRELGGTDQGMNQSMRLGAPLGGIAQSQHGAFYESLSPRERDIVDQAEEWYYAIYEDALPPSAGRGVQRRTVRQRR